MNRRDFQELTRVRLEEAKCLLDHGSYSGAYYLSGYVVECALKACIAKRTKRHDFPDKKLTQECYTHDLEVLIRAAELQSRLEVERKNDILFEKFWFISKDWTEQSRYGIYSEEQARGIFEAITDRRHGVLRWIRRNW